MDDLERLLMMHRLQQQQGGGMMQRPPAGMPPPQAQQPMQMIQPQIPGMPQQIDPDIPQPGMMQQQPQMPPQLMDLLKQKFMSGGATDIRNMGMGAGMGRMSMGGQVADPIRQMLSQTGSRGLRELMEMLRMQQQQPGAGPLMNRGGGTPMARTLGTGYQPNQRQF